MSFYPTETSADNIQLVKILDEYNVFDDSQQHRRILCCLESLARDWICWEAAQQGMAEHEASQLNGKLLHFGSWSFGAHQRGHDVDVILVAPNCIRLEMFFQNFLLVLKANTLVSHCIEMPRARVPMIQLVMANVEIDLLFVSLKTDIVPDLMTPESRSLMYQDEWDQISLVGLRTTDAILKCVSDTNSFRITLHLVKLWAKRKWYLCFFRFNLNFVFDFNRKWNLLTYNGLLGWCVVGHSGC